MSTKKLLRELKRELQGMGVTVEVVNDGTGHPKLLITHRDGRTQRLTAPSSPHDINHSRAYLVKYVRTFANRTEARNAKEPTC